MSRYTRFSGKIENSVYLTRVSFLCVSDSATYSSGVVRWMDDCRSRSSENNLCSGIWHLGWKKRKDWKVAPWRREGRYKTSRVENPDFKQWNHPTFRIHMTRFTVAVKILWNLKRSRLWRKSLLPRCLLRRKRESNKICSRIMTSRCLRRQETFLPRYQITERKLYCQLFSSGVHLQRGHHQTWSRCNC